MTSPSSSVPVEPTAHTSAAPRLPQLPRLSLPRFDAPDQVLAVVASVLWPLGLLMILLGWFGAARTPNLFEQVPYLISGGLLGLALVISATLMYFGAWIARSAREQRASGAELLEVLRDIRAELQQVQVAAPAAVQDAVQDAALVPSQRVAAAVHRPRLVSTVSGSMVHRADCAVVVNRDNLRPVDANEALGRQPCRLCDPFALLDSATGA